MYIYILKYILYVFYIYIYIYISINGTEEITQK